MPNKQILIQYATLKLQAKKIEDELEMLRPQVQAEVEALIGDTDQQVALQDLPGISLALGKMKAKWKFSKKTQADIKALEEQMEDEKKTGEAINLNDGLKQLICHLPKE